MATYIEMLADPEFVKKLESKLTGTIVDLYLREGKSPPIPRLRDHKFHYDDPTINKAVERVRLGFLVMAQVLDDLKKAEEKAPE
ncbi:hypothetical protein I6L25_12980 [Acinetobacter nosocomialis]|uniref:hypothetical protein n=1 Tax=Acinetobacter nosocomialis TaxID=106654 RepID=UPI0002CFFFB3|nr:hypothetical protein [Acinetobacter nosocomialis]ENU46303.1 hypothetical protein F984_02342 [Acinetobacter nosocomialis NIPH 2119]QXC11310.1 hypothetical protein I6L25_12980 [Acinetobacter nosocomialis]